MEHREQGQGHSGAGRGEEVVVNPRDEAVAPPPYSQEEQGGSGSIVTATNFVNVRGIREEYRQM